MCVDANGEVTSTLICDRADATPTRAVADVPNRVVPGLWTTTIPAIADDPKGVGLPEISVSMRAPAAASYMPLPDGMVYSPYLRVELSNQVFEYTRGELLAPKHGLTTERVFVGALRFPSKDAADLLGDAQEVTGDYGILTIVLNPGSRRSRFDVQSFDFRYPLQRASGTPEDRPAPRARYFTNISEQIKDGLMT
eukprot:COSAG02_NODE_762_length_17464_cov_12.006219_1_plen_195_part_00